MINFSLEACIFSLPFAVFKKVVAHDQAGRAKDGRAELMRSFPIPLKYNDSLSRDPQDQRYINISLAFITTAPHSIKPVADSSVYCVADFSRFISYRVFSRDTPFRACDLQPGTLVRFFFSLGAWTTEP